MSFTLITRLENGLAYAVSNFHAARIMHDGATRLFVTWRYLDRIRPGDTPLFEDKLVPLDSRRVDTLMAIPL